MTISDNSSVQFFPLHRNPDENGNFLIGRPETSTFIVLPKIGIEIIDLLQNGMTVGEVKQEIAARYGEEPKLESFLQGLLKRNLIERIDATWMGKEAAIPHYHFAGVKQQQVAWMVSKPAWVVYVLLAWGVVALLGTHPQYIPKTDDWFFTKSFAVVRLTGFVIGWLLVAAHELAHLFFAKALGVEGRFSISNRLFNLVAQTDITGLWAVEKGKRYWAHMAGMILEVCLVFFCLCLLLINDIGLFLLPGIVYRLLKAIILLKLWGLAWQFNFYMRTDVYFMISNFFGCKSLMGDSRNFAKNWLARLFPRIQVVNQKNIPAREMKAVRIYAGFFLIGTVIALANFFLLTLPITLTFLWTAWLGISNGYASDPARFIDGVIVILLFAFNYSLLGYSIVHNWRQGRQRRLQQATA